MIQKNLSAIALILIATLIVFSVSSNSKAQALSAGTVTGTVVDPNGAVVPNATVIIANPITGYKRTANTESDGSFHFNDVPPNNYQVTVSATGFSAETQSLTVRTSVPINIKVPLAVSSATETVTVTGSAADVLENVPTSHTDVDQSMITSHTVRSPGTRLIDDVTM